MVELIEHDARATDVEEREKPEADIVELDAGEVLAGRFVHLARGHERAAGNPRSLRMAGGAAGVELDEGIPRASRMSGIVARLSVTPGRVLLEPIDVRPDHDDGELVAGLRADFGDLRQEGRIDE